jgi:hypothetical protein
LSDCLTTQNDETALRNTGNAEKAYREAVRFFEKSEFDSEINREITRKITFLNRLLARIEEKILPLESEG